MKNQDVIQNATIAVYSNAHALTGLLMTNNQEPQGTASSINLSYDIRISSSDEYGLDNIDALIYDLSLVDNDIALAATDVLRLKIKSGNKPLILIGSRNALENALNSSRIKPEVAHTIVKPMSHAQLRFVSEAAIIKHDLSHLPAPSKLPMSARVCSSVAVTVALAFVLSIAWMLFAMSSVNQNEAIIGSLTELPSATYLGNNNKITNKNERTSENKTSIEALMKLASLATHQRRLAFPHNDNVLNYYKQILAIDGDHQAVVKGHKSAIVELESSLAKLMSDGKYSESERLLSVLLNAAPSNAQYRRIALVLNKQKLASYQANAKASTGF